MGTVLGQGNPVLSVNEHYVREVVLALPPLHCGSLGFDGEPTELYFDSDIDTVQDNFSQDTPILPCVGYEHPFWPNIYVDDHPSDAYFMEFEDILPPNNMTPLITISDFSDISFGVPNYVNMISREAYAQTIDSAFVGPSISTGPTFASGIVKKDAGTMALSAYWDVPSKDFCSKEDEMPDLFRRLLSEADPLAPECVYLSDGEIKSCLQWGELDIDGNVKAYLFAL